MPLEPVTTTLEKIFYLTPTVRTFRLRFPKDKWIPFKAGQFCMVQVPKDDKPLKKAYSICSAPFEEDYLDLCIKLVEGGYATNWFWTLKEGDPVTVTLPYGTFVIKGISDTPENPVNELVFVATGTGLAPLRSMIKTLVHENFQKPMTLIFGVRHEEELLYTDEWKALEKTKKFKFIPTISRPKNWTGEVGYVQEKLKKFITDPKGKLVFVCGLVPMIDGVLASAQEMGFDKKQIHFEKYV